jgi:hypothetical protein
VSFTSTYALPAAAATAPVLTKSGRSSPGARPSARVSDGFKLDTAVASSSRNAGEYVSSMFV